LHKNPLGLRLSLCYAALTVVLIGALRFPMAAVVLGLGAVTMGHVAWKLRRGASA